MLVLARPSTNTAMPVPISEKRTVRIVRKIENSSTKELLQRRQKLKRKCRSCGRKYPEDKEEQHLAWCRRECRLCPLKPPILFGSRNKFRHHFKSLHKGKWSTILGRNVVWSDNNLDGLPHNTEPGVRDVDEQTFDQVGVNLTEGVDKEEEEILLASDTEGRTEEADLVATSRTVTYHEERNEDTRSGKEATPAPTPATSSDEGEREEEIQEEKTLTKLAEAETEYLKLFRIKLKRSSDWDFKRGKVRKISYPSYSDPSSNTSTSDSDCLDSAEELAAKVGSSRDREERRKRKRKRKEAKNKTKRVVSEFQEAVRRAMISTTEFL